MLPGPEAVPGLLLPGTVLVPGAHGVPGTSEEAAMQRTAINTGPPTSSFLESKPFLHRIASPSTDK
jgi:hypothetical protein